MVNRASKILIFSPSSEGGIAEHTYYQAEALHKAGARILCLVSPSFLSGRKTNFPKVSCLSDPVQGPSGLIKKLRMVWRIVSSRYMLAWKIMRHRPDLVLLDSYVEYLAPLWIDPHIILSRIFGFRYAANLHDPVRSYVIGPMWWHRLSVWLAYQPLDMVFVHDALGDSSVVPKRVRVIVTPHGLYNMNLGDFDSERVREGWGILRNQKVFLSFGYVRDGKNLHLAIRALQVVPEAVLVVAGSVASTKDKPFEFYRDLARKCGVSDRCRFFEGFVDESDTGRYFSGADFILLTYSSSFHSQSGVLNLAVAARKPVLASASPSPLMEVVAKYHLGITVKTDSMDAITDGMKKILNEPPHPEWEEYEKAASWDENARIVLEAAVLMRNNQP